MGVVGFLALAANVASVLILMRYKDGDANVRSVWLCSRNDAIGNVAVMVAALGVWGTATGWPDLIVAGDHGGLFLTSSVKILGPGVARSTGTGRCTGGGARSHEPSPTLRTRPRLPNQPPFPNRAQATP